MDNDASHWTHCRAFDGSTAGGDFIECIDLGSGRHGLFVGDVCGRGAGAHTAARMLHAHARARLSLADPAALLEAIDQLMRRGNGEAERPFASLFVAISDAGAARLSYASAGHETAMLVGIEPAHHLVATGPLLGLGFEPAARFRGVDVPYATYEYLIVVTDGITDARPPRNTDDFFGTQRVLDAFGLALADGRNPASAVYEAAAAHSRHAIADDASVLVLRLRRAPSGARSTHARYAVHPPRQKPAASATRVKESPNDRH